ncbi:MAG: excinuclease ABC subunit A, partial [Sandaracinaceae bacterium]|nr:excinuclease ABC subunit A [Sandaracinaceae bacterium]
MIRGADRAVELGPGVGERGGRIVFDGPSSALAEADTATGLALRARREVRRARRGSKKPIRLRGASGHNLKGVDLRIPRGVLTCVTGVSGSGKSSLVLETLVPALLRARGERSEDAPLAFDALEGHEPLTAVVHVDQGSLGRTSRGNPATYLKVWDVIRKRFASEKLAKERGYTASAFSFNVPGGRCEACGGEGAETVEMQFLADVTFSCPECGGRRFVGPVLDVKHRDLDVAEILERTADEILARFEGDAEVCGRLSPLSRVGLGYLRLGQSLNTLSGGEAQRLRLAATLGGTPEGALIVLDEPTAGLHHVDVTPLLETLHALVDRGDTVVVVEHDMRVAAEADWVIDLGPGAGERGGSIVAEGTPEDVAGSASATAPFLAQALCGAGAGPAPRARRAGRAGASTSISVQHAREHNLKDVSVEIPREKLVVVTGPSGSGKSTLAFDVVFAEGQRRYLETLSPYARQYMPQLPRPDVDRVAGVPPTVSLEQRTTRGGASSTVATITEVSHYVRLLWARAGLPHCPEHGEPIAARSPAQLASDVARAFPEQIVEVLAPVVRGRKGLHRELLAKARKDGFQKARIDGVLREITPGLALERFKEHDVELLVAVSEAHDRLLPEAIARAAKLGEGAVRVAGEAVGKRPAESLLLSTERACPACGRGFPELDPRFFSFNTRQGQCASCEGQGAVLRVVGRGKSKREIAEPCAACEGTRLSPLARAVTIGGAPITDVLGQSVSGARAMLSKWRLKGRDVEVGKAPLAELDRRLAFLEQVGVGYLGLDRPASTLSGGETQRVRLAAQLGSGLTRATTTRSTTTRATTTKATTKKATRAT